MLKPVCNILLRYFRTEAQEGSFSHRGTEAQGGNFSRARRCGAKGAEGGGTQRHDEVIKR